MPKITLNLQITKKKKKRKYVKKYKGKIGRDLVKDTVGSNQLLDFNDLNNLLEANQSINTDDQNKYYDYIDNLRAQQSYQLYGGDPDYQYQLKKVSKTLYTNLKNSLFDDSIRQDNIVGPPPDDEPIISNSWDAVPGGTATSIGSFRPSFTSSFVQPTENIGSSSSVQNIDVYDAYEFPTATVITFDPLTYMKQEIKIKLSKDKYIKDYPSNATILKWFSPIKKKIIDEGFVFGENYKQIVRDVYTELYPESVPNIPEIKKTELKIPFRSATLEIPQVQNKPVTMQRPKPPASRRKTIPKFTSDKEIPETKEPKTLYYQYGEEAFPKPKLPSRRPKSKKIQESKQDIYNMFEENEQLMNYSTEIPKPLKSKQPKTKQDIEEIKKQRAINKAKKALIKEEKKQIAINKKELREIKKDERAKIKEEKEEKNITKIKNPKTNRMVSIDGKLGSKILQDQKKTPKFKKAL